MIPGGGGWGGGGEGGGGVLRRAHSRSHNISASALITAEEHDLQAKIEQVTEDVKKTFMQQVVSALELLGKATSIVNFTHLHNLTTAHDHNVRVTHI